jgi:GAF domain-containing protein
MTPQQQHPADKASVSPEPRSGDPIEPQTSKSQAGKSSSKRQPTHTPAPHQESRLVAPKESTKALTDFAADLATIGDLDRLCSFIAERAAVLVAADEAAVYLKTRPLSANSSTLQLTLPLRVRGEVLGVLTVARRRPQAESGDQASPPVFNKEYKRRLTLLTSIAAVAIAGIKREQAARRRSDWRDRALDVLQETGRVMGSTLELVPLMRRVIDVTVRALRAEAGMLALLDDNDQLVLRAVTGAIPRDIIGKRLDATQSLIGWVTRHGRSALVSDSSADPRASLNHPADSMGFVARALVVAPLVTKGQTIGAIEVANKRKETFDEGDRHLLEALALSAAAAIENARLYERLQRQALQQENMIRVGHAMSSAQDVDAVFQEVVESALSVIPTAFTAVVHLLDQEQGGLNCTVTPVALCGT